MLRGAAGRGQAFQDGGKPRPYYIRAWQADSLYSRGDPLRSPWGGGHAPPQDGACPVPTIYGPGELIGSLAVFP